MEDPDVPTCPLCLEDLDATDRAMQPCRCSYVVCCWCLNHIRENLNGLCPACRTPYEEQNFTFKQVSTEAAVKEAKERATAKKERERRAKEQVLEAERAIAAEASQMKAMTNLKYARFVQRNLVYVIGLSLTLAREEVVRKTDMFGRFGRILKVMINRAHPYNSDAPGGPSMSAYILFARDIDASAAVRTVNNTVLDGREVRTAIACTKYCDNLVRTGLHCGNADCLYIHELFTSPDDILCREEVLARQLGPPPPAHLFLPVRRRVDVQAHAARTTPATAANATAANAAVAASAAAANAAAFAAATEAATTAAGRGSSSSSIHLSASASASSSRGQATRPSSRPVPLSHNSFQNNPPQHYQPRSSHQPLGMLGGHSPPSSPPHSNQSQFSNNNGWGTGADSPPSSPSPSSEEKRSRKRPPPTIPIRHRPAPLPTHRPLTSVSPAPSHTLLQPQQHRQKTSLASAPPGFGDLSSAPPKRPPGFGNPRGGEGRSDLPSAKSTAGSSRGSSTAGPGAAASGPPGFDSVVGGGASPSMSDWGFWQGAGGGSDSSSAHGQGGLQSSTADAGGLGSRQQNVSEGAEAAFSGRGIVLPSFSIQTAHSASNAGSAAASSFSIQALGDLGGLSTGGVVPPPPPVETELFGLPPLDKGPTSRRAASRFGFARDEPGTSPLFPRDYTPLHSAAAYSGDRQAIPPIGLVGQSGAAVELKPSKGKSRFDFAERELSPPPPRHDPPPNGHLHKSFAHIGGSVGGGIAKSSAAGGDSLSVSFSQLSTQDKLASIFQSAQWAADDETSTVPVGNRSNAGGSRGAASSSGRQYPLSNPSSSQTAPAMSNSTSHQQKQPSPLVPPGFREATPESTTTSKTSVTQGVASSFIGPDDGERHNSAMQTRLDLSAAVSGAKGMDGGLTGARGNRSLYEGVEGLASGSVTGLSGLESSTDAGLRGVSAPSSRAEVSRRNISQSELISEVELERQVQAARAREAQLNAQLSELQQQIRHFDNVRT